MRKPYKYVSAVLAAAVMLVVNAVAQQTPASSSAQTPPAKTQTTPAAKAPAAKAPSKAAPGKAPAATVLKTQKDKASYAIGQNIGKGLQKDLQRDSVDVDPNLLVQGLKDALSGSKSLMTDDEIKSVLTALQADVTKKNQEKMQVAGEKNKTEGEAFLAANKAKDGVVALPSGLQYKVLQQGTGPKPTAADTVVCNYRGTLLDGTEFDSSYKRGQPATFAVGQVIHGWTEALQLMPVGSKWQLFIPSDLAYGPNGAGGTIGPNATLVFEVELLSIQPKK